MNICKCLDIDHLHGAEAKSYVNTHLKEIKVDINLWQTLYQCPDTKVYWKEYYKYPETHGSGPPELIKVSDKEAKRFLNCL